MNMHVYILKTVSTPEKKNDDEMHIHTQTAHSTWKQEIACI